GRGAASGRKRRRAKRTVVGRGGSEVRRSRPSRRSCPRRFDALNGAIQDFLRRRESCLDAATKYVLADVAFRPERTAAYTSTIRGRVRREASWQIWSR